MAISVAAVVVVAGLGVAGAARDDRSPLATTAVVGAAPPAAATESGDLVGAPEVAPARAAAAVAAAEVAAPIAAQLRPDCRLEADSVGEGDAGLDVGCLQQALIRDGYLTGEITGTFDAATAEAVTALQERQQLFVDGVAGRETALFLNVWRDEQANVVRTPPPAPGAVDGWGFELSPVATGGADAPPLPAESGSGRRVVYSRDGQRVWAVDDDGTIIRSYLVSGSKYDNEQPGFHEVYSRSEQSTAWNGQAILPLMIRYQETDIGAIGFHGMPVQVSDGSVYQTDAELGTRLSGGCQRQNNLDAQFLWAFADVGTPVVVV
jgi:peptidoglycan hydrolase-like protein with peptidoglycan-binding domain